MSWRLSARALQGMVLGVIAGVGSFIGGCAEVPVAGQPTTAAAKRPQVSSPGT
jgi:hypothetical protein